MCRKNELLRSAMGVWIIAIATATVIDFTDEPKIVAAPIGDEQLTLQCYSNGRRAYFYITLDGSNMGVRTDVSEVREELNKRGITVVPPMNNITLLIINATNKNKHFTASCMIAVGESSIYFSPLNQIIEIIFFGPPTNLTLTVNGLNSLRVEWSSPIIEGANLQFILTVNSSSSQPLVISNLTTQHYNFTMEGDPSSCDVYTFQVTALNDAGASGPSEIITKSLPSLPDISPVNDSLEGFLHKSSNNITLNITSLKEATSCPDYPVLNTTLIYSIVPGGEEKEMPIDDSDIVIILEENSRYHYYFMVTNQIGSVNSTIIKIVTTDVQSVSVSQENNTTYSINCCYISGSDARGYVFILVGGVEGVANITGVINRTSSQGVLIEVPNIDSYREVLAFDLESDNTTGALPVRGNITSDNMCISTGTPSPTTATPPARNVIIIVVPLFLLMAIIVGVVIIVIVLKAYSQG